MLKMNCVCDNFSAVCHNPHVFRPSSRSQRCQTLSPLRRQGRTCYRGLGWNASYDVLHSCAGTHAHMHYSLLALYYTVLGTAMQFATRQKDKHLGQTGSFYRGSENPLIYLEAGSHGHMHQHHVRTGLARYNLSRAVFGEVFITKTLSEALYSWRD